MIRSLGQQIGTGHVVLFGIAIDPIPHSFNIFKRLESAGWEMPSSRAARV